MLAYSRPNRTTLVKDNEKPVSIKEFLAANANDKRGRFGDFADLQEIFRIVPSPSSTNAEENKKSLLSLSSTITDLKAALKIKDDKYAAIQEQLNFVFQPGVNSVSMVTLLKNEFSRDE